MRLLLDTHTLLWVLSGDTRLSANARTHYESSSDISFSVASLWEIGIKLGLDRPDFQLQENWWQSIPQTLVSQGVRKLEITDRHCGIVAGLPLHHRDPFDRLLVSQAIESDSAILSSDKKLDAYDIDRIW